MPQVAVFFDLDGTLLDTAPDFIWCLNQQRALYDLSPLPEPAIRSVVSDGARGLMKLGFDLTPEDADYGARRGELLDLYETHIAVRTHLFPGMEETLAWLDANSLPWGIVTNKPRFYTTLLLEALGLDERCGVVVCPDDVSRTKPDPESLFRAAEAVGAEPGRCLYAGDHRRDIEAGLAAGMTTVAVRYGYLGEHDPIEDWGAHYLIDHGSEFLPLIQC